MEIDTSSDYGARVARRLREEEVIWLVTVDPDGTPQPSPVWFLWQDGTILVYSQPRTPKLRNIARQPRVALHFNSDSHGDDVVVLTGTAEVMHDGPAATDVPAYLAKYDAGIAGLGMNPAQFAASFSVPVRITPARLRGF